MKKKNKILAGVLAGACVLGGGFALTACGEKATLELFSDFQTEYYYGEELNVEGGVLEYKVNGKTVEYVDITEDMVSGFDNTDLGIQTIVIEYKEASLEISVMVERVIAMKEGIYYGELEGQVSAFEIKNDYIYSYSFFLYDFTLEEGIAKIQAGEMEGGIQISLKEGEATQVEMDPYLYIYTANVEIIDGVEIVNMHQETLDGEEVKYVFDMKLTPSADANALICTGSGGQDGATSDVPVQIFTLYQA